MSWKKAKDAAWREFGRRYWKAVLGLEIAKLAAPGILAALAAATVIGGVWWLVKHAQRPSAPNVDLDVPGRWWWWPVGALVVVGIAMWVRRRRDPLAVPLRYRPGAIFRRVVAVLAIAGLAVVLLVWREA